MNEIAITGLTMVGKPKPNANGSYVIAYFDCEASGVTMFGCVLVRTVKRGLTMWPPKLEGKDAQRRSIIIKSDPLRHAITLKARDAYKALGGQYAEWIKIGQPALALAELPLIEGEAEGLRRFLAAEGGSPWDNPNFKLSNPTER